MIRKTTRRLRARAAAINPQDAGLEEYGPEPNMKLSQAFLVVLMLHVVAVAGLYAFNSMKAGKSPKAQVSKATPLPTGTAGPEGAQGGSGGQSEEPPEDSRPPVVAKSTEVNGQGKGPVAGIQNQKVTVTGGKVSLKRAVAGITGGVAVASGQAKAQEAAGKTYTVAPGDTLTRIASTLGVSIPELEKINGLASNSVLRVGQVLKVPEKGLTQQVAVPAAPVDAPAIPETAVLGTSAKNTPPEAASASASTPPDAPLAEYIVVKGDNPYKIAKRFKVSFEELMKVNGITDAKKIQIGQKLRIPAPAGKTKTAK